jgi:hypothetical protein
MNQLTAALRVRLAEYLDGVGVELRPSGNRLVGRCPMHDDRTPSFAVFGNARDACGCHPCGFTGDVFALSEWLGRASSFPDALRDVAGVLGVPVPLELPGNGTRQVTVRPRPAKPPTAPVSQSHLGREASAGVSHACAMLSEKLSDSDREKIHEARLAWTDAFHAGEPIVDDIAASLGFDRETLRQASWGSSGLGLAPGWLCYRYPNGLKWRNPEANAKPRFVWLVGKATAPWRMDWVKPETRTVIVTEGESDAMAMIAAGIEDDGCTVAVASPGTSFPRDWAPLFRGKRTVLCFDTDPPGRVATATVAAILKGHAAEILTWKGAARHV